MHMSKYIFDVDANLSFRYTKSHQPQYSLREMYNSSPLMPVYDENEKYGYALAGNMGLPASNNVMADHHFREAATKKFYTNANVSLGVKLTSFSISKLVMLIVAHTIAIRNTILISLPMPSHPICILILTKGPITGKSK